MCVWTKAAWLHKLRLYTCKYICTYSYMHDSMCDICERKKWFVAHSLFTYKCKLTNICMNTCVICVGEKQVRVSPCACIYMYMYIYMYICIYKCVYVGVYICIHMYMYIYVHM